MGNKFYFLVSISFLYDSYYYNLYSISNERKQIALTPYPHPFLQSFSPIKPTPEIIKQNLQLATFYDQGKKRHPCTNLQHFRIKKRECSSHKLSNTCDHPQKHNLQRKTQDVPSFVICSRKAERGCWCLELAAGPFWV